MQRTSLARRLLALRTLARYSFVCRRRHRHMILFIIRVLRPPSRWHFGFVTQETIPFQRHFRRIQRVTKVTGTGVCVDVWHLCGSSVN